MTGPDRRTVVALAAAAILVAAADLAWLARDDRPPPWDVADHLAAAERFRRMTPGEEWRRLAKAERFYPPLVPALAGSAARPLGTSRLALTWTLAVWRALLAVATGALAAAWIVPEAALPAALLVAAFPETLEQGHQFMLDVPLAATVALAAWALGAVGGFRRTAASFRFGIVAGLGLLVKWTLPIYLAAPVAAALVRRPVRGESNPAPSRARGLAAAGLAAALVCGFWYAANVHKIRESGLEAAYRGADIKADRMLSLEALAYYPRLVPAEIGWPATLLLIAGLVILAASARRRLPLAAIGVPILLLLLMRNRKDRYLIPALPFLAVAATAVLLPLGRLARRRASFGIALIAVAQWSWWCLPLPLPGAGLMGPRQEDWQLGAILAAARPAGPLARVAVIPDHPVLSQHTLAFLALRDGAGLRVAGVDAFPDRCDAVVVKTGDQGPAFSDHDRRVAVTGEILGHRGAGVGFGRRESFRLPDGSTASVFARRPESVSVTAALAAIRPWLPDASGGGRPLPAGTLALSVDKPGRVVVHGDHGQAALALVAASIELGPVRPGAEPGTIDVPVIRIASATVAPAALLDFLHAAGPSIDRGEFRMLSWFVRHGLGDLRNAVVTSEDGLITARGRWGPVPVRMDLAPSLRDGVPAFSWEGLRLAGLPVPAWLLNLVAPGWLLDPDEARVRSLRFGSLTAGPDGFRFGGEPGGARKR